MPQSNREYKSSLFTMLLEDKERALDVYNALNDTSYDNADDLEIMKLENAVYLSFRNDASFILEATLNIYEHQSTYNPNMPLRDLIYVANLLAGIVKDENLYGTSLVKIPLPQFVTFYNGVDKQLERVEMKLSDAYNVFTDNPQLELKCIMLNLNKGYNKELMSRCETLKGYMTFVDKVRDYQQEMPLESAVDSAIEECIKEHVLEDFMKREKAMVRSMSVLEFNLEKQLKFMKAEGIAEGSKLTLAEGIIEFLEEIGNIPDNVKEAVLTETNLDILKRWNKLAARSESVEEFVKSAGIVLKNN